MQYKLLNHESDCVNAFIQKYFLLEILYMYVDLSHCHISTMWTCIAVLEYIHAHILLYGPLLQFLKSLWNLLSMYMNYGHFYFYNQNLSVQCLETFMLTSAILKLFPHYNVLCALPYILLKFYFPVYGLSKFYMDFWNCDIHLL